MLKVNYFNLVKIANNAGKNKITPVQTLLLIALGQFKYLRFFIIYNYLKWVDDIIDNENTTIEKGTGFLKRQKSIIINGEKSQTDFEKLGLYVFRLVQKKSRNEIKNLALDMFKSFEMDLLSRWKLIDSGHFYRRNELVGYSGIKLLECILAEKPVLTDRERRLISKFYIETDIFSDLQNDMNIGYCFIPGEVIEKGEMFLKKYLNMKIKYLKNLQPVLYNCVEKKRFCVLKLYLLKTIKKRLIKIETARVLNTDDNISNWANMCRQKYVSRQENI